MNPADHSYYKQKTKRELKTLLRLANKSNEMEKAKVIQEHLDTYASRHPQETADDRERKRERRTKEQNKKLGSKLRPYFKTIWIAAIATELILMLANFWLDGSLLGKSHPSALTTRQLWMLFTLGIIGFTWGIDEYLRGPGNGYSLYAFRNSAFIITSFLLIAISVSLLLR